MSVRSPAAPSSVALWILAVVAVLFFLRAAKPLLIPVALSVLISYALEPAVAWLSGHRLPRALASAVVLVLVAFALVATVYVLSDDALQIVEALPTAIQSAREALFERLGIDAETIQRATQSLGSNSRNDALQSAASDAPITTSFAQRAASALLTGMGDVVVILFLVFFLLISGTRIKHRLIDIAGSDAERKMTVKVVEDINAQIQRYLLVLLLTAAIVGVATWLVLSALGVRHALFWGLLAGLFNSIPYFGPVIVSGGLFVVGMAEAGGLDMALRMTGAALVITSLEGWLLTPALMGRAERMNALVVFLGLLLWTWLWGAWGTVLAVPMLALVKAVADQVHALQPLGRLMAR